MNPIFAVGIALAAATIFDCLFIVGTIGGGVYAMEQAPPLPGQEQPEILTRGPVHEAFAEPVPLEAQAALIVSRTPPANIQEIPPADRPQGGNYSWVPGYWGWDADRADFIWVSACWRIAPPNTYWVPGYWAQVSDVQQQRQGGVDLNVGKFSLHVGGRANAVETLTWEWVSGFWASAESREIEYLPTPPAVPDITPSGPAPSADTMWVPGCWYWRDGQYVLRPGYWQQQQADWVWTPSHYRWTPRGYVFEAGHWDYPFERRGVLFAPVYIPRSVYSRSGYAYSPRIAVDLSVLSGSLFAYPRYGHYYYGDYYDDAYLNVGIYPQFESERRHTWYDPVYTYNRWHNGKSDRQWDNRQRQQYDRRRKDQSLRPARTYQEMTIRSARMSEPERRNAEVVTPLQKLVGRKDAPLRFEKVDDTHRQEINRKASNLRGLRDERMKWESERRPVNTSINRQTAADSASSKPSEHKEPVPATEGNKSGLPPREVQLTQPERVKIPAQPQVVDKPQEEEGKQHTPPAMPKDERNIHKEERRK